MGAAGGSERNSGHPRCGMPRLRALTVGELRGCDLCAPVEASCKLVVLGRVPERAAVLIDAHGAVITPAVGGTSLRTGTGHHLHLGFQGPWGIGREAAGEEDRRIGRCPAGTGVATGFGVTEEDI